MNTKTGLREQIANAGTENEVIQLLSSGNNFKYASSSTRLSWKHTAQRRIRQLQKSTVEENQKINNKNKTVKKKSPSKK